MMNMRRLAVGIVAAAVLAISVPAVAQRGPGGGGGRLRMDPVPFLTSELGLSKGQQDKAHKIIDAYRPQLEALRGNPNSREKREAIIREEQGKLYGMLTSSQKEKLDDVGGLRGL